MIDCIDDLLAERGVGNAPVVQRLVHEALVHPDAGSVQQVLGHRGLEAGTQLRAVERGAVGTRGVDIVEGKLESRARHKALVVGEIVSIGPGLAAGKEAGGWIGCAIDLDGR